MASGSSSDDDDITQATVYIERGIWEQLRLLGLPSKASASAQLVTLAEDYLAASERRKREVLRRAAQRGRGRSTRARAGDVVDG